VPLDLCVASLIPHYFLLQQESESFAALVEDRLLEEETQGTSGPVERRPVTELLCY
jgi:hypothetical protein